MSYVDKTLVCAECGEGFTFSASEQEFFATKGFTNEPKRCPRCRGAARQGRRDSSGSSGGGRQREMHAAVCASCGKATQVPFEPRDGRPVYCSDCFNKVRR